ncbi:ABC transporter permease [Sandaracinus amylolyticus]|uniref:ABC transport system, permease component YbhR n=1 Tax=Sandaracinus amylolyticus TaxID=927083 RepID=A0A0F6W7G2_9BACT|nr:ABC transporter permease [Sandaracinus amylolyticus]AKF09367.1 ABC transport system, permease component YbhR [Sandaracinus amylolyticus]
MLAALRAVVTKEVRQTLRDKRMMALLIAAPVLQLVIFGNAVSFEIDRVPTVVVDHDRSAASRTFVQRLLADRTLELAGEALTADEAARALVTGRAAAAVVIEQDFARRIARGVPHEPATVQVIVDGTNPNKSSVAANAASRFSQVAAREAIGERLARLGASAPRITPAPSLEARVLYNPRLRTPIYMVPGIMAMLLLVVTTIITAMGLARERESGTLEQVLVTPVRPAVLIAGKMLPFAAIGLFDFGLAMAVGAYGFDMPIRGSLVLLSGVTLLYLVATLSAGLLISTISRTQQQAFMGGFLFMLPAALLSGIMTPIHAMPAWLQPLTLVNPLRHYAIAMRAVLLRGAGPEDLLPEILALAAIGGTLAVLAATRFRKTLA